MTLHVVCSPAGARFYWTSVNLWTEDVPGASLVVLAGADELLHAEEVRAAISGAYRGVPLAALPAAAAHAASSSSPNAAACSPEVIASLLAFLKQKSDEQEGVGVGEGAVPKAGARVLWHPTAGHADWLLDGAWQAEVATQILSLAAGEAPQQHLARRPTALMVRATPVAAAEGGEGVMELPDGWALVKPRQDGHTTTLPRRCATLPLSVMDGAGASGMDACAVAAMWHA
jgi:hypothetical protein